MRLRNRAYQAQANVLVHFILSSRKIKQIFVMLMDVLSCLTAVWFAMFLRLDEHVSFGMQHVWLFVVGVAIFIPTFTMMGLYSTIFRYTGFQSVAALFNAFLIYTVIYASVFFIYCVDLIPRTLGLLQPIIFAIFIIFSRISARYYFYKIS